MPEEEQQLVDKPNQSSNAADSGSPTAASEDVSPSGQGDVALAAGQYREHTTENSRFENPDASMRRCAIFAE